jgi:hypothetical protein
VPIPVINIGFFKGDDCGTDHYLMIKLSVIKGAKQTYDMERFNLKKLNNAG